MKKRIAAVIMVFVLFFTMDAETLYAVNGQSGLEEHSQGMAADDQEEEKTAEDAEQPEHPGEIEDSQPEGSEEIQEKNHYTVTFLSDGGSETEARQVEEGELLNAAQVAEPIKTGYLFQGWMMEDGTPYDFQQPVMMDINLKAQWFPITYKIRFDANKGTGSMGEIATVLYDQEVELPENCFTRKGYLFEGWELAGGTAEYSNMTTIKNLTDQDGAVVVLRAVWSPGSYKVRFDRNGGTGSMKDLALTYGKRKALTANRYKKSGYTFAGWNTKKDGTGKAYKDKQNVTSLTGENQSIVVLYAMWKGVAYRVSYSGNGADSGTVNPSSHVYGVSSRLSSNKFKKKGYTFAGWNTRADGKGTTYPNAGYMKNLTTAKNKTVRLYAKWRIVKYNITYVTKGGRMEKSCKKSYTVTTKTFTLPRPVRKGYDFDGWYTDSKYKNRIGEIRQGHTRNYKFYAKWTKGTAKAKKDSAKITYCSVTRTDRVVIKASVKKRIASGDDYYYLVYVNPVSKKLYKMAAKTYKKKNIVFHLNTTRNQGYVTSMFGIAIKKNGKYTLISTPSYVKSPKRAAENKSKYKTGSTKKGLQFSDNMEELYKCGAKNTFLNVTASMVFYGGSIPYQYNGKTYYFNDMTHYREIVAACNRKGISVTMQIMLDWVPGHTDMIASQARVPGASLYYTWNISSISAREKMEAMFCYLGNVFGKKGCCVSNWVLGNEVNNPNGWNYKGSMTTNGYFKTYAYCFRSLYYAVKSQYSNANIFICVDNLWNTSVSGGYSAKTTITSFVSQLKKIQRGVEWNLAYHAYSTPLTNTRFWNGFGITYNEHTPFITMNNIKVLTNYIKKNYGSSVRIILSEQGYSSTWGQKEQAAAIAYSYYIAACNPMIDSFIIRSYSDHPIEVAQGLCMGIQGKEAFAVYKYMDTSRSARYTNRYLHVIGARSWKDIVPGYSASRIRKMYRKT